MTASQSWKENQRCELTLDGCFSLLYLPSLVSTCYYYSLFCPYLTGTGQVHSYSLKSAFFCIDKTTFEKESRIPKINVLVSDHPRMSSWKRGTLFCFKSALETSLKKVAENQKERNYCTVCCSLTSQLYLPSFLLRSFFSRYFEPGNPLHSWGERELATNTSSSSKAFFSFHSFYFGSQNLGRKAKSDFLEELRGIVCI